MGVYGKEPQITGANLGAQMVRRTKHVLLELQKNDTIAFRFKNGSYHCYNHFSNLNVNGVNVTTQESSIETLYSRGHTSNWFMPSFVPNVKQDLDEASITDFTPLRPTMSNGAPDVIGEDNWKAVDGSEDHMISNFYFRMTIKF
ncbi:unnamed protein product [Chondrus crispus]|uniref:Uncharacterized protein n=1 Tax=Chondrus crispus TaxID=2769 RepID=R7QB89_CHOCR|nr:unnamed protein product [Chondrus crispus]CDF34735.1 unnamed protein product [Chondrus crispus]|eukprot:XP_005714554.1 unnamed protein product [Chondrus crispus]